MARFVVDDPLKDLITFEICMCWYVHRRVVRCMIDYLFVCMALF